MGTLGKNQIFEIKNEDGTSFHNLVLHKSTVESIVMSLGDKISGDVYYKNNTLSVSMHEYIVYNGVKYMLVTPPTIIREGIVSDNSELRGMTKYSFVFYHPMYVLANFPFCDVAVTSDEERYLGESKKFSWIGYPNDYIAKLNKNLDGTEWIVEKSSRFPQDKDSELSPVIPFENATIADALKTWYDTWGLPYIVDVVSPTEPAYAQGKRFKVVMGMASNEVYENESARRSGTPFVFRMGHGVGLKNNSRTPRNNKIVTRISGCGSENNIPYGYPQIRWYGASDSAFTYGDHAGVYNNVTIGGHTFSKVVSYPIYKGILGGAYVELINHPFTRKNLMPSVYRTCLFNKVSFLNTDGTPNLDYDPDIELVDYYDAIYSTEYPYPNPINVQSPSYESHTFEDIKPELGEAEIVSATPLNNDLTPAESWDDTIDNDGNYIQSYFKMVLSVLSFDLYACAAVTEEMQINMRSGSCLGCTFTVQVDWDDYKRNFYDEDGNFAPDGEQRDLSRYPKSNLGQIEVVLQKEDSTFGTIMPNMYQYPVAGDDFVILGISLPDTYITTSEHELDDAMKSYMLENNEHYFDYPLKFDEAFLSTHEHILSQIRPNTIIRFEYAGETLALSVKQLSVKFGESPLPKYDITLTDNVEVVLNQIGKVADDVEKLSTLIAILRQEYNRNVWSELAKKLSKTQDDTAQGFITFLKGLQVGNQFVSGLLGEGGVFRKDADGKVYIEADKLYVRMRAYFDNVEIKDYEHTSGNRIASKAGLKCVKVEAYNANDVLLATNPQTEPNGTSYYRLYFRAKDGEDSISNDFVNGDQAFCDKTTYDNNIISHHRYWRLVVGKNGNLSDDDEFGYIDLSATDKESGSDVPKAGDDVSQLGNRTNTERQGAIIEFVGGDNAPAYQIYQGINTYSLSGKCMIDMGFDSQTGLARMNVAGNFRFGSPLNTGSYIKYDSQANQGQGELKIKAHVEFTNSDAELDALVQEHQTTYDDSAVWSEMDNLQDQIDGAIESWFLTGVPTLQNAPANAWTTDAEKNNHIGDLYYDKATGHGYRFMFDNEEEVYLWTPIVDDDIARALENAAHAQETADGKRTVYSVWNAWVKDNVNTLEVGDLFIPTANTTQGGVTYKANKVYKCITKGSAVFQAADYIDDAQAQAKVDAFVSGTYSTDKQNLQSQIDGKAETFRQAIDPALSWTDADKPKHVGDLWMDISSNGGKKTYIYEDKGASASPRYKWEAQEVPDEVFDEIDGKSTIYGNAIATPPTNYKKDDMWLLPADATINGVNYKAGDVLSASQDSETYSATHWSKRVRYTDDTKADSILNNSYYQQLVGGTISQNITNAANAASAAQSDADAAQSDAAAANTRLTTWADDTKISPTEKLALKNQKADVMKEYAQIITDAAKYTGVSTTAFTTAYNKAITAFNYYTASTPENIAIITDSQTDSDATPRYSRIADYYAARQTILEAITTAAKNYATTQGNKFLDDAVYRAISAALGSNTDIVGGLVLTSLIGMRDSSEQVWGGISGQYDATAYGYGIAAWYGGAMVDKEVNPSAANYAQSLFRMDGSGYLAGGNIKWTANGQVTISDLYTMVSGDNTFQSDVLNKATLFSNLFHTTTEGTTVGTLTRIQPQAAFQYIDIDHPSGYSFTAKSVLNRGENDARYLLIDRLFELFDVYNGNTNYTETFKANGLPTDKTNISIKAKYDFWSQGGVTALGQGSQGGGGGQGDVTWALLANNSDTRPIALSHLTDALAGYALKSEIPSLSGYATQSWVSTNFALKSDIPTLATLSWSGYSSGSYNGSEAKTISIPSNTNQLTNGAGFVTSSGVTSVATGTGLTGGTITSTGTISINSTYQTYISHGESAYNSLGNYLPLSGGTIVKDTNDDIPLRLQSGGSQADCYLGYNNYAGTFLGYIGYSNDAKPILYYNAGEYEIWHKGNLTNNNQLTNGAGYITSSALSNYLPLSGGTMTGGNISWNDDSHGIYFYNGCGIEKWLGYGPCLVTEGSSLNFWVRSGDDRDTRALIIHSGNIGSQSVNYASSAGSATTASQLSATILPSNANLNDYKTTGVYGQLQSSTIATFTNRPSTYSSGEMRLEVIGCGNNADGYLFQKYWARRGDDWDLFIRSYSADTTNWTVWATNIDSRNIGSQSVNYANSAGSVAWDNVSSKPAAVGGSNTPVYWTGSGFSACTDYASASVNYASSAGNADTIDGYHGTDLGRIFTNRIDGGKAIRISFSGSFFSAIVSVRRTNGSAGLILIGNGYGENQIRNTWAQISPSSIFRWSVPATDSYSKTIEISNEAGGTAEVYVTMLNSSVPTFTAIDSLYTTGMDCPIAYTTSTVAAATYASSSGACSGNAASATQLQTARSIWGQSFDGTGNVNGTITINAADWDNDYGIHINECGNVNYGFDVMYGYGDLFKIARRNGDTTATNSLTIHRTGGLTINEDTVINGLLQIHANSNSVTIGSQNSSWCHIFNSEDVPFIFNKNVFTIGGIYPYSASYEIGSTSYRWGTAYVIGVNCTTSAYFCTSSGSVGIGTSSPSYKLDVLGDCGIDLPALSGIDTALTLSAQNYSPLDVRGKGVAIRLGHDKSGNYSSKIACVFEDQNPSYLQPSLAFYTMYNTYAAGSEVERMRIASNGYVGIGTSSPSYKLHVAGDICSSTGAYLGMVRVGINQSGESDSNACIEMMAGTGYIDWHYGGSSSDYTTRLIENASGQLSLYGNFVVSGSITGATYVEAGYGRFGGTNGVYIGATYAGGSNGYDCIERAGSGNTLYIQYYHAGSINLCNGGGNVMIGSGSPSYKLHVAGDIYATGGVTSLSDSRHKTIMGDTKLRVEQIAEMPAIIYKWNDRRDDDLHVGSIAQHWQRVLPEVVSVANDLDGTLSINYGVAAMIASIVTAKKVVDHEARIKALESENRELKEEIRKLKIA